MKASLAALQSTRAGVDQANERVTQAQSEVQSAQTALTEAQAGVVMEQGKIDAAKADAYTEVSGVVDFLIAFRDAELT